MAIPNRELTNKASRPERLSGTLLSIPHPMIDPSTRAVRDQYEHMAAKYDRHWAAFTVFDMPDSSDMVPFGEPFFMALDADVRSPR